MGDRGRRVLVSLLTVALVAGCTVSVLPKQEARPEVPAPAGLGQTETGVGAAAGLTTGPAPARGPQPFVGFPAPTITGKNVHTGQPFSLADLQDKPTLVNFFATWCAPCRVEMPAMEALFQERSQEFNVVSVGMDSFESSDQLLAFAREVGVTFPVIFNGGEATAPYQLVGVPTTLILDRKGIVRSRVQGVMDLKAMTQILMSAGKY